MAKANLSLRTLAPNLMLSGRHKKERSAFLFFTSLSSALLTVRLEAAVDITVGALVGGYLHKTDFATAASGVDVAGGFSNGDGKQKLSGNYGN